jgi:hypothetical protein
MGVDAVKGELVLWVYRRVTPLPASRWVLVFLLTGCLLGTML